MSEQYKEDARIDRERFHRLLLDSATDAIMVSKVQSRDDVGFYIEANKYACKLSGFSRAELMTKAPEDLFLPMEGRGLTVQDFGLENRNVVEVALLRKDGRRLPVEVSSHLVTIDGESFVISVARDISQHKRVEKQLRKAKEAAEAANRAKSEFLTNMSHELRTPLNGVIGMVDLLIRSQLGTEQQQYAEVIKNSGEALMALLDDLLDYSKVESGQIYLVNFPFILRHEVQQVVDRLRPLAKDQQLEFEFEIDSDLPDRLLGDPVRVKQVLSKLVGNAIKFTPSGRVRVEISSDSSPAGCDSVADLHDTQDQNIDIDEVGEKAWVRFSVRDTGIGIPAERLKDIFYQFTQVDSSPTRSYGGTGIGLAIANKLVSLMGGRLQVESQVNQGSTFSALIPFYPDPIQRKGYSGKSVLVVEDDPVNQQVLVAMLKRMGLEAQLAYNGQEAVSKVLDNDYSLVLMDLHMPGMNGLDAARAIRLKEQDQRNTVIIATTACVLDEDRRVCIEAGMNDFVSKPFTGKQLEEVLRRWMDVKPFDGSG